MSEQIDPKIKKDKGSSSLVPSMELIAFEMNQSLLTSRQRYIPLLWEPMPIQITGAEKGQEDQIIGSIIYEEVGSRELSLSFFTSTRG